jgi:ACS family glucarate transporter-like MFS transporter
MKSLRWGYYLPGTPRRTTQSVTAFTGTSTPTRVRYTVLFMLFAVTSVNYADRATLSIAGPALARQLGLSKIAFGYALSAFGWAYVVGQLPGGWLLDRFGSKRVYAVSILVWSAFTLLQGFVGVFTAATALALLCALRFSLGLAEAPSFPGNGRIVAAWFPKSERGTASAVFNSAQYFATVMFAPITGWLTYAFGWPSVFFVMGGVGLVLAAAWARTIYSPQEHPRINRAELDHIRGGGGLVEIDAARRPPPAPPHALRQLLGNRMLMGVYVGQYCITTITYFFLTWFPDYLVTGRGMSILKAGLAASLPALCGFFGGVLGGVFSDVLLKRGYSLTAARKIPIVLGMLLSVSMILCNYVDAVWLVVSIMALAFFGKGIGSLGWAVVSDTSPREIAGLSGGLFNMFGNTAAITTPIVIGYIVQRTGSFNLALVFVAANALTAIACYLLVVGEITRVELHANHLT